MTRNILRERFYTLVEIMLEEHISNEATKYYQNLLKLGVEPSRAIEIIAFYQELFIRENTDDNKWEEFISNMPLVTHMGEYYFDHMDEKRNLRYIKKQYGVLKSDIENFEDELFAIETHLAVIHDNFLISSHEAKKIIHIVIDRLLSIFTEDTSNYSDYCHEDIIFLADGLEQCCNPFVNNDLKEYLLQFIDVDNPDNFDKIFKAILLCLARIISSIDMWDKELGKDGYFKFIEQFIDSQAAVKDGPGIIFNDQTIQTGIEFK